jgi:hypothetical protein
MTLVKDLYPFLENVLRELNKERRNKQIQLNLQYCETMKVKSELLKLRANVIKITDETVCPICKYRLGDAYVLVDIIVEFTLQRFRSISGRYYSTL